MLVLETFKSLISGVYGDELRTLVKIAWPIALTSLLQYTTLFTSMVFCGHVSKQTLDGAALASNIVNVFGTSLLLGLSSACDTLFSQTFGSANKQRVGIMLQRSILVLLLTCLPVFAIFMNTEHLLRALGQDEEVARLGGKYATIFIAGIPGVAVYDVISKYLQSQSVVLPSLLINIAVNCINAGFHVFFMFYLHLGIVGAALSVSLTQWMLVFFHVLYIVLTKIYKTTWQGFSLECLLDWGEFCALAVPAMIMFNLEMLCFEIYGFLGGYLGVTALASCAISFSIETAVHFFAQGISIASAVRVGYNLGEKNVNLAKVSSKVSIFIAVVLGLTTATIIMSFRNLILRLFSNDRDVISYTSVVLIPVALDTIVDYLKSVTGGILRGIGHQKFGAYTNLVCYYLLGLPVGIPLMLLTYLEVSGAWWALIMTGIFQFVAYMVRISMCDWEKEAELAQVRAGIYKKESLSYNSTDKIETALKEKTIENEYPVADENTTKVSSLTKNEKNEKNSSVVADDKTGLLPCNREKMKLVIIKRLLTLLVFVGMLIGGIIVRIYLDFHLEQSSKQSEHNKHYQ